MEDKYSASAPDQEHTKEFLKLLMSRGFTRNAATFRARFYIPSMYSSYLECYRVMAGLD